MLAELGQFLLALALAVSLVLALLPILGSATAGPSGARLMATAGPAAAMLSALVALAFVALAALFVRNDFSVLLVATHSNLDLPLHYRVAATWGSHEGSMLLWVLILAAWTVAVSVFSTSLSARLRSLFLRIIGMVECGFLRCQVFTSNSFGLLVTASADRRDLNRLLQDAGMMFRRLLF